jgi:hypothetical protein
MNLPSAFRNVLTLTLTALSASCTHPGAGPAKRDEGSSRPGPQAAANECLRYPVNVVPPVSDALAASGPHAIPRILVVGSGKVVLLDDRWRLMVWNPAAGPEALLLPGAISRLVAGAGDVLFERNLQGSVSRLAIGNGAQDAPSSDECRGAAVVSRIRGAPDRPVVGLMPGGGAVIQFGEGTAPGCTVVYRTKGPGWTLADAQASRDLVVVTEAGSAGASRAIFHRYDNSEDRIVPIHLTNVEMAADAVVFWSWDEGNILVASTRDPSAPRPITLFAQLPSNRSCVDVEATAGRFILFRNECTGHDGAGGPVQRVLFDAGGKKTVATLDGLAGPVGVTPGGTILAAGTEGVCTVRER